LSLSLAASKRHKGDDYRATSQRTLLSVQNVILGHPVNYNTRDKIFTLSLQQLQECRLHDFFHL